MNSLVYLRPLKIEDAQISFKWRNDPSIWVYTGFVPNKKVTAKIEKKWLAMVLNKVDELRMAICINETNEYIGNVQLRNINIDSAEFEVFIGEKKCWRKGIGYEVTMKMLKIAFFELKLLSVFLYVHPDNIGALECYKRAGFEFSSRNELVKMVASSAKFTI